MRRIAVNMSNDKSLYERVCLQEEPGARTYER